MRSNNHVIRYVGKHQTAMLSEHLDEFLSLRHAEEHLVSRFASPGDTLTLWRCNPSDSSGEAYSRIGGFVPPSHRLTVGPEGGVKVERNPGHGR